MNARKWVVACIASVLFLPALAQTGPTDPVTRADYAAQLWTAFDGDATGYSKIPGDKATPASTLTREGALFLLVNKAMANLRAVETNLSVLDVYSDAGSVSPWARAAVAFAIQIGIFVPGGNAILPQQLVTNAEAQAWIHEARHPEYTFLSTNDFHGQLEIGRKVGGKPVGGAAYDMAYIQSHRALNPLGTLLLDAGDFMQGTPISNLLHGRSTIDVFNHMGYQAATIGNHEFDWGQAILQERAAQAEFPLLVANVFYAGTDTRPDWLSAAAMLTVKGQQIGLIGVTSMDTPNVVSADDLAGLEFRDPAPLVDQLQAELRAAGADIVVVLAHMPNVYGGAVTGELNTVAQPGVDLIIAGHNHAAFTGLVRGVQIIEQYSSGTAIGVSQLGYDRVLRRLTSSSAQISTTYNLGVTPDPAIAALVAGYQAEIAPIMNAVKATTLGAITRTASAAGESPLGNLIADAHAWRGGTQIAFTNPGSMRADLSYAAYPHDLTYSDLLAVQPFDDELVTMTLTGSELHAVLEQQLPPAQTSPKVLAASGITYAYDLSLPAGSRVTSLALAGAGPIADDATPYTVTVNEYLASGGDGFSAFVGGTNVVRTGTSDLDALIEYVQHRFGVPPDNAPIDPAVYPTIEGRVTAQ